MDRHIIREDLKVRNMGITAAAEATPAFFVRVDRLFCGRPAAWNSLPDYLRDPSRSFDSFRRDLKTFLFSFY